MCDIKPYMTIEEAAVHQGCSSATIWRRIKIGKLRCHRILGRTVVHMDDVDALHMPNGERHWHQIKTNQTNSRGKEQ